MVIYQFSNSLHIFFIIFFSILILISIIIGVMCFPILKLLFEARNSPKAKILLLFICGLIYVFCTTLLVFSAINIAQYSNEIVDTNIENCIAITGKIEEIQKEPQYSRGADLVSYHICFSVDGVAYYIDTDIGVVAEDIEHWGVGEYVTVYYREYGNKNTVICVEKHGLND